MGTDLGRIEADIADEFDMPDWVRNTVADLVAEVRQLWTRLEETSESKARIETAIANGEASDGYHTHKELYEYRMLYNAHAALGWLVAGYSVVKSWKHHDGEPCFGKDNYFVVVVELPAGQISNHYKGEFWDLFAIPEVETAPEWDGHTPAEAAERLRDGLGRVAEVATETRNELRKLSALEAYGVDNWEGYEPAMNDEEGVFNE
jgi:hypothetical protein